MSVCVRNANKQTAIQTVERSFNCNLRARTHTYVFSIQMRELLLHKRQDVVCDKSTGTGTACCCNTLKCVSGTESQINRQRANI